MFNRNINNPAVDDDTKQAMLKLYTDHQAHSGIASASAMTLLGFLIWNNFPDREVIGWLLCGYAISLTRAIIHPWIKRNFDITKQYLYNKIAILSIVTVSGLIWGFSAWLFLDIKQTEIFVFVIIAICGISAGAVSTHASYLPALWLFISISLSLLAIKLILIEYHSLALLALLFSLLLMSLGRSMQGIIKKSFVVDQRNQELLKEATKAKEQAEIASKAKSNFLATASHDLRQPLHAIALLINVFKTKSKNTELTQIANNMESSADAMMSLFDSILDVSRLDAGITQAHNTATDLHDIINTLVLNFKTQAEKKGLTFTIEYQNTSKDTPCIIMADKIHLERCLNNMVNNAIKFTQTGHVSIKLTNTENNVQLSICDSGEGIAEKDIAHIFNEFSQARTQQRAQEQGLGLGLSIVKRLTQLMEMEITVTSTLGEGSCFTLSMNKAPEGAIVPIEHMVPIQQETQLSGLTALIVDDDIAVRESLKQLIESWDCTVFTASDLSQAETAVKEATHIDALLIDYGLRDGVTGLDVIEHLFTTLLPHKPPVLIITGDTSSQSMTALNASNYAFLHKPAKPIKIRNFLQRIGKNQIKK